MTPNRVNSAHWPTKENMQIGCIFFALSGAWRKLHGMAPNGVIKEDRQNFSICFDLLVHGKNSLGWPQMGIRRIFVPTNLGLADILGRTDLNFENYYV